MSKRVLAGVVAAMAATTVSIGVASVGGAQQDLNCPQLTFEEAQTILRQDPSDPNGLDARPGPADGNDQAGGDGIACEDSPRGGTTGGGTPSRPAAPTRSRPTQTG
jgi:hypothetical protein